jgi:hypothetical protein
MSTAGARTFELLLRGGKVVRWEGVTGEDAARRYVDCHRETAVIAWREIVHGLFIGAPRGSW